MSLLNFVANQEIKIIVFAFLLLSVFSAGPAIFAKLRSGGMVLLDDAHRSGERKILSRWRRAYPDIEFTDVDTMKVLSWGVGLWTGIAAGLVALGRDRWRVMLSKPLKKVLWCYKSGSMLFAWGR